MEGALIEMPTMGRFTGIDMVSEQSLAGTTILTFRHLHKKNDLARRIYCIAEDFVYEAVKAHPKAKL